MRFSGLVQVLRMPQLSPTMTAGKITKWYARTGEVRKAYELIVAIEADKLTKVNMDKSNELEIELQEEFVVGRILFDEGAIVNVDVPIAVVCEVPEDHTRCALLTVYALIIVYY